MRVRLTLLFLVLLGGCQSELERLSGSAEIREGPQVAVRTRPVCGNGRVEEGEECDGESDCTEACQRPCAEDDLEILSCRAGRSFAHRFRVTGSDGTVHGPFEETWVTQRCRLADGRELDVGTCNEGACFSLLSPGPGQHICAPGCGDGCPSGTTCAYMDYDPDAEGRLPFRVAACIPAAGGGLGDQCGLCGSGLGCNRIAGAQGGLATCLPSDCDTDRDCPDDTICADATSVYTGESTGRACFASANYPFGTRADGNLECESRIAVPISDSVGHCSRNCSGSCPGGFQCLESQGGDRFCYARSSASLSRPEYVVEADRTFPGPGCPADIDETCTFESECDPDCSAARGCGEVPEAGLCDGPTLRYCEQHRAITVDCAGRGLACGYDAELARFDCVGTE